MPSFDIVSKTDLAEVDNALANMTREMSQRYDFKNSKAKVERKEPKSRSMPTTSSSSSRCTNCCRAISPAAKST